jgi:hypothetical protein
MIGTPVGFVEMRPEGADRGVIAILVPVAGIETECEIRSSGGKFSIYTPGHMIGYRRENA